MKAIVLGSAAGDGFPQWHCRCANCALAWARDPRAAWRTQSSLALITDDGAVLLNASPDLGEQLRKTPPLWPQSARHSPIRTVVLTSAEIDHIAGLVNLRERHLFDLVALAPAHDAIADNMLFRPLSATASSPM
jgi:pyrroloquinoline quinone biosynthesis protein B